MKKNLTKKLVLAKHTLASLDAEKLAALRGGNMDDTYGTGCNGYCEGRGGGSYYCTGIPGHCIIFTAVHWFTCPC